MNIYIRRYQYNNQLFELALMNEKTKRGDKVLKGPMPLEKAIEEHNKFMGHIIMGTVG